MLACERSLVVCHCYDDLVCPTLAADNQQSGNVVELLWTLDRRLSVVVVVLQVCNLQELLSQYRLLWYCSEHSKH